MISSTSFSNETQLETKDCVRNSTSISLQCNYIEELIIELLYWGDIFAACFAACIGLTALVGVFIVCIDEE